MFRHNLFRSPDDSGSFTTDPTTYRATVWEKQDIVEPGGLDWHKNNFIQLSDEISALSEKFNQNSTDEELRTLLCKINEFYDSGYRYRGWHEVSMFQDGTEANNEAYEQASNIFDEAEKKLLVFKDTFASLPEDVALHFITISGLDAAWLKKIREAIPHTLPLDRENYFAEIKKGVVTEATIRYQGMRSSLKVSFRGEEYTYGGMTQFIISDDRETRREATLAMEGAIEPIAEDLFNLYKIIITAWHNERIERGFESSMGPALLSDRVPESASTALLGTLRGNLDIYHSYFEKKAALLGIDSFTTYDLSAPITSTNASKGLNYHELISATIAAAREFHPRFAANMEECLTHGHILSKSEEGANPQPGEWAFPIAPGVIPYALFIVSDEASIGAGHIRAISHELGHIGHFGAKNALTPLTYDNSGWTVEVASLLSEILTAEYLQQTNPDLAKEVLGAQIDSLLVNVFKAGSLSMQEVELHRCIAEEGGTYQDFIEKLKALTGDMYGENVDITENCHLRFLMTQQLFTIPMQVISYPAGALTALAVYELYQNAKANGSGKEFAVKVMEALSAGGSITPSEFLTKIGDDIPHDRSYDITSEEFWSKGFNVLRRVINRMDD